MREMKDSGIEYIGQVPKDWQIKKMKYYGILDSSGVDKKIRKNENLYKSIHYTDVYKGSLSEIGCEDNYLIISATPDKVKRCMLKKGDVLFTNSSETPEDIGHSTVIKEDLENTLFGYHLMRFRPVEKFYLKFEKYLFGSTYMRKWFEYCSIGMTRYGINNSAFSEALLIVPTYEDQKKIADFLDEKVFEINKVINLTTESIKEYKKYKQSLITESVTKGLNPDVVMKDSGIEWIGKIPEQWRVSKIKYVTTKIGSGKTPLGGANVYADEGVMFIRSQNVYNENLSLDDVVYITEEIDENMKNTRVEKGDILLNITGGSIGRATIFQFEKRANVNQHVCIIRVNKELILNRYLHYIIISNIGFNAINIYQTGANREGLNFEQIGNIEIPFTNLEVQRSIVYYLDMRCSEIDSLISQKKQLLSELEVYKKSLIYECVTGKREVS